ncbi:MAG TPA: HlyD family efflux transporter periplasmic adaptor subunit [Vitreimonas sp.]|nr:HlyD family efflux transporter periplasmic adaptor subunit [Vitreimonas sp.]
MKKMRAALTSFFHRFGLVIVVVLAIVFAQGLVLARYFQKPEPVVTTSEVPPRKVNALRFGSTEISEQAVGTVKNLSSITLVAQTAGPVGQVKVAEGKTVKKGTLLLNQTSAYGAGSAATVQRQIAGKNYELAQETLKNTVEVVSKNRELADKNRDNTEELRKITEKSIDEIKSILTTTDQVISKIESDIATEQASTNNATTIQSLRQSLITYRGIQNSNRSGLRSAEYAVATGNPPTKIADITKDLVYKTTELQLKQAQINQEVSALSLQLAKINEASTRVVAPFSGTIEKVYVNPGQYVTPGTPVAKIKGDANLSLQISVAGAVASRIDAQQDLIVVLNDREFVVPITHVSSTPINGQLFEVLAVLPAEYQEFIPEESAVAVTLPLYTQTLIEGNSFLPLDAIFVTNNGSYVLVAENGRAVKKVIETGEIVGSTVEIKTGPLPNDIVILDRRVLEGEAVEPVIQSTPVRSVQELG